MIHTALMSVRIVMKYTINSPQCEAHVASTRVVTSVCAAGMFSILWERHGL